jgi:hypothetical protein
MVAPRLTFTEPVRLQCSEIEVQPKNIQGEGVAEDDMSERERERE